MSHGDRPMQGDTQQSGSQTPSQLGPFAEDDEAHILTGLLADIDGETKGFQGVVEEYRLAVDDEQRVERAIALEKHVADSGAGVDLSRLIEVLYFAGRQGLLRKYSLRFPAYNILDQFFVGSTVPQGPRLPARPAVAGRNWSVFGREIGFPIGIPASVLTSNSEWLQYFYHQGFNVLTTRTVRSRYMDASAKPNWVFVPSIDRPFDADDAIPNVVADSNDWVDAGTSAVSTSNSFGVPSYEPEYWMEDLRRSLRAIMDDGLLIVSVMGDVYEPQDTPDLTVEALVNDFVMVAKMAESCGAEFIELNMSCPNSLRVDAHGVKPPLCYDLGQTVAVIQAVRAALGPSTRIIAKLSYLQDFDLESLLKEAGHLLDGVAGINTVQTSVLTATGEETFPGRRLAGVSGIAVRNHALEFVRSLARLRLRLDLNFEILGMGGVTDAASFQEMYDAGATVVLSASGAFANPFLADQCIRALGSSLGDEYHLMEDDGFQSEVVDRIRSLVARGEEVDQDDLAVRLALPGDQASYALEVLVERGLVERRDGRTLVLA